MYSMKELTPKQQEILDYLRRCIDEEGMPPTRAEICAELGFSSPNAADQHLRALAKKGAIELIAGVSRGLRIVEDAMAQGLPLIGSVAAGSPILAEANVQGRYPVSPALFDPKPDYLLRVRGLSMKDAGILEDDWVAVHRTSEARNGQIVVARLGNDVTVKRFHRKGGTVSLLPENAAMAPIVVDPERDALAIEGLVVGVIRSL